jgi:hypothetical protein
VAFNFFYMLPTLHFELFILILGYSMDTLFVYATLEWMLMSVDNTVFVWNVCPESSETDGIRTNAVYLHSGAKGILWNSFLLHQYTASSISRGLWSRPAKHLLECCRAVLARPSEWPFVIVMVAFQCSFSHGNKKVSQGHKSGEYGTCGNTGIWCTEKILWQIVVSVATHCHAGGTTFLLPTTWGNCRVPSRTLQYTCVDIVVCSFKQSWPHIAGLSAIHSFLKFYRQMLYHQQTLYYRWTSGSLSGLQLT